jgi:hypothetical protein
VKAWAILGYTIPGAAFCAQCFGQRVPQPADTNETHAVLASNDDAAHLNCDACGIQLSEAAPEKGTNQ